MFSVGRLLLSVGKKSAIVFSGLRREVDENCVLLGYYAAGGGNSVPTIGDNQSVPSSGAKKQKKKNRLLKIGCPETSVRNCHYLLRNNPEQCRFQFDSRLSDIYPNTWKNTLCAKFISINTLTPSVMDNAKR
jgi:hypothetical protein